MISKSQIKLITGLRHKKYRDISGLFVAEGPKLISDLEISGLKLHSLFSSEAGTIDKDNRYAVSEQELQKISFLKTANTALALFEIPNRRMLEHTGLILALDAVRDPGNLGTIIRLCDWFGIRQLVCSPDTADCYNPKVVQASMGSIARVTVHYLDLEPFLKESDLPVYGAVMNGANVYATPLEKHAVLVMGNEANGISKEVEAQLSERITIPRFGVIQQTESLNVATATAILLSEFRRTIER